MIRPLIAAGGWALAMAAFGPVLAQSAAGVEQLSVSEAPAAVMNTPQVSQPAKAEPMAQISAPAEAGAAPVQLAPPQRSPQASTQLSNEFGRLAPSAHLPSESRSAEGPEALSQPSQGRTGAVERITGEDRCDPQNLTRLTSAERGRCAQVIERRSAEFTRPAPRERSPEERLLTFRQQGGTLDAGRVARNLADGDIDDSFVAQAVASGATRPGGQETAPAHPADNSVGGLDIRVVLEAVLIGAGPAGPDR